jgi:hypothetical protein
MDESTEDGVVVVVVVVAVEEQDWLDAVVVVDWERQRGGDGFGLMEGGEALNTGESCDGERGFGFGMSGGEARERMLSVEQGALHAGHRPSEDGPCSHFKK